jgi:hypothetical protein
MQALLFKALSELAFINDLEIKQLIKGYLFSLFNGLID